MEAVQSYFNEYIHPLQFHDYQLVITGPIASGKSTLIHELSRLFADKSIYTVKEYLDNDPTFGQQLLSKFINKSISPMTMQSAIIDSFESQMPSSADLVLYERIPDDNLLVFSNIAQSLGQLSAQEFNLLYDRTRAIDLKYHLPSYFQHSKCFMRLNPAKIAQQLLIILRTMHADIRRGQMHRIVGLSVDISLCKSRLNMRQRQDENKYSDSYLQQIITTYERIYTQLEYQLPISASNLCVV